MGYTKEKYLEGETETGVIKETEVTLSNYPKGEDKKKLTPEEEKRLDDIIDCQIEDAKIRRDEEKEEGEDGI